MGTWFSSGRAGLSLGHKVFPTQQDQVAANTSRGSLFPHRAGEGNSQDSKGHQEYLPQCLSSSPIKIRVQFAASKGFFSPIPTFWNEHFSSNWVSGSLGGFSQLKWDYLCHKQLPSSPVGFDQKRGRLEIS